MFDDRFGPNSALMSIRSKIEKEREQEREKGRERDSLENHLRRKAAVAAWGTERFTIECCLFLFIESITEEPGPGFNGSESFNNQ